MPSPEVSNPIDVMSADHVFLRRTLLVLGGTVFLGGCATGAKTKGAVQGMQDVPLEDAPVMPTKLQIERAMAGSRTRVVVMQPEEVVASRGAGLPAVAIATLEQMLGRGVEIVDRNVAGRLDAELKRAEMMGGGSAPAYSGGDVADFAISVVMGAATWTSQEVAASQYIDKKTGKPVITPRSFTHGARSSMTVRVFEMPSLRLVSSIPMDSSVTVSGQPSPNTQAQGMELMRRATENAINENRGPVLNDFAPRGYATERRVKGDLSYFRTTLGKRTGAKIEQDIEIVRLQTSVDPLTKKRSVNEAIIAKGVVSDDIGDDHSYVAVKDAKEAARVRKGDVVRTKFDPSFFEKGGNFMKRFGL